MLTRFRFALGLAILLNLIAFHSVFAKGSFSFITVTSSNLKEPARLSDPALTTDFFAFADFYQDKAEAPVDPGTGYEITRYYVDSNTESAFDKLHYYPDTEYVYYDGIVNGSSEYDAKWYTANQDLKSVFEAALNTQIRLVELGNPEVSSAIVPPPQSADPVFQTQPNTLIAKPELILPIIIAGSMSIMAFAFWRRRSFAH
jgi:hypothetical protein